MKYFQYGLFIFLVLCLGTATVQSAAGINISGPKGEQYQMAFPDSLIIHGNGWAFKVLEPIHFPAHIEEAARYQLNAYFCPPEYNVNNAPAVMYIRVLPKGGYTVEQRLEGDMKDFRNRYTVEFSDFEMKDLKYTFAAKKYLIDDEYIDYLCYVDPDSSSPLYVIFVLSGKKEISEKYLKDFQMFVHSFEWINPADVEKKHKEYQGGAVIY